jgi:hypothetical protein
MMKGVLEPVLVIELRPESSPDDPKQNATAVIPVEDIRRLLRKRLRFDLVYSDGHRFHDEWRSYYAAIILSDTEPCDDRASIWPPARPGRDCRERFDIW